MTALSNDIVIGASAGTVWQVIAHEFGRIGDWATAIPASHAVIAVSAVDAPVAGRVCETGLRMAPVVTETVVAYDDAVRTLTYEATAGLPAFVTLARNRWQVTALDENRARVSFQAQLEVRGILGRLFRWWLLARVGRDGRYLLEDLKHHVEHGTASPRKYQAGTTDPALAAGKQPTARHLRAALRTSAAAALLAGIGLPVTAGLPVWLGAAIACCASLFAWIAVQPVRRLRPWAAAVAAVTLAGAAVAYPMMVPAAIAAALALWQLAGLAAVRGRDPLADTEIVQASRVFAAAPAQVWPLLTDHSLYGQLARNLSKVEVISDPGQPLRRRCTSSGGQAWEETCTLWDDGRRFAVTVDTSHYPYPLLDMRGLWQVDPHPAGSLVTMRFAYRVLPSVYGGLFAIALRAMFPPILSHIFHGWRQRTRTPAGELLPPPAP